MPGLAHDTCGLKPGADLLACQHFFGRETVGQRAVGEAQAELRNQFRMVKAALFQIRHR
ncbi:TPA: hypothetical protein J1Z64_004649, partial [Escherichia coli]|nr:hypothetical protein [Escherichia coli]